MERSEAAREREQALGALEVALQRAAGAAAPAEIRQRIDVIIPPPPTEHSTGAGPWPRRRVSKVTVTMPEKLVETVRAQTGRGEFSQYVTESVEERVRLDGLEEARRGTLPRRQNNRG
jgi:hypothetical protein